MQIIPGIPDIIFSLWFGLAYLCGMAFEVYRLCVFYKMIKDVNVACEGDGDKTTGLGFLFLLNYVTLGVYSFIWWYKFGKRLAKNAPRYGMKFKKLGSTMLVLKISKALFILFFCAVFFFHFWFTSESSAFLAIFYPSFTGAQWIFFMFISLEVCLVGFLVSHFILMGVAFKHTNRICAGYNAAHNL